MDGLTFLKNPSLSCQDRIFQSRLPFVNGWSYYNDFRNHALGKQLRTSNCFLNQTTMCGEVSFFFKRGSSRPEEIAHFLPPPPTLPRSHSMSELKLDGEPKQDKKGIERTRLRAFSLLLSRFTWKRRKPHPELLFHIPSTSRIEKLGSFIGLLSSLTSCKHIGAQGRAKEDEIWMTLFPLRTRLPAFLTTLYGHEDNVRGAAVVIEISAWLQVFRLGTGGYLYNTRAKRVLLGLIYFPWPSLDSQ